MMDAQIAVAKDTDYKWLMDRATGGKPYDLATKVEADGSITLTYDAFYDAAVKAERDGYKVNYLEVLRPKALKRVPAIRSEKMQMFLWADGTNPARPTWAFSAIPLIDAKLRVFDHLIASALNLTPTATFKLGDRWYRKFDKTGLTDFCLKANDHVQACFDRESALVARIEAAKTIDDKVFAEIETGWPE